MRREDAGATPVAAPGVLFDATSRFSAPSSLRGALYSPSRSRSPRPKYTLLDV